MDPSPTPVCPADHRQRFVTIVVPHLPAARRIARRYTGNCDDADEVTQDAAVRMLRFIGTYRGGDARSWVMSVARNTALAWLRKHRRYEHVPLEEPDDLPDAVPQFPPEYLDALRREVAGLPEPYRDIVRLRHFDELSYSEISTALDIPMGTVMSRLARARDRLRERL